MTRLICLVFFSASMISAGCVLTSGSGTTLARGDISSVIATRSRKKLMTQPKSKSKMYVLKFVHFIIDMWKNVERHHKRVVQSVTF